MLKSQSALFADQPLGIVDDISHQDLQASNSVQKTGSSITIARRFLPHQQCSASLLQSDPALLKIMPDYKNIVVVGGECCSLARSATAHEETLTKHYRSTIQPDQANQAEG